jgi:tRNA-specific 2-thiouridylase
MMDVDCKRNIRLLPPSFSEWASTKPREKQIAVLMSGGVDSSVTAHLLKEDSWDVLGITMKIPVACNAGNRGCCGADAALVCNELNIPHYFVDVSEAFEKLIIESFRRAYSQGLTPNPCVDCNTFLKFSLVWDFLESTFGIKYLATGHYARTINENGCVYLYTAKDKAKDQSYFLCGIHLKRLPFFVLPLGELYKSQVRSIAARLGLSIAKKAESMELCFAGEDDYRAILSDRQANQPGEILDMKGMVVGQHKGISNYTLGQRRGIGFAGGNPLYVGRIDAKLNTISLGTREEVSSAIVKANKVNIILPEELTVNRAVYGKIRSYGEPHSCRITGLGKDEIIVKFDNPHFAPCPGQKLVLYDD